MGRAGGGGSHGGGHFGGGGHLGGGHVGGHSSHGGGFSSGHSGGFSGGHSGGYSGGFGHSGVRPPHGTYSHQHYGGPRHNGTARRGGGCGGGCGIFVFLIILIFVLLIIFGGGNLCSGCINAVSCLSCVSSCVDELESYDSNTYSVSKTDVTTVEQLANPKTKVNISDIVIDGYYTDELDWIRSRYDLEKGMKEFYELTGVAPYLYITDNLYGNYSPDYSDFEVFCEDKYTELFNDEGHLFVVFREYNDDYDTFTWCGNATASIMDDDTIEILLDYFDAYYYDDSLSDEEYFSTVFSQAAKNIMGIEKEYAAAEKEKTEQAKAGAKKVITIVLAILGGVVLIVGAIIALSIVFTKKMERDKQKAEETERILNTPLKNLADESAEELAKKYENKDN